MSSTQTRVLIICYGNPGRLDDGLGAAFAAALEGSSLPNVTVDTNYQLTVEDAAAVAENEVVIFIDAAVTGPEPFFFREVRPVPALSFSSHSVDPENLLALAEELFSATPKGYALGIRGYEFNKFGEVLSPGAKENLAAALRYFLPVLQARSFSEAVAFSPALETDAVN
jgi:hydrogenase maturation protease